MQRIAIHSMPRSGSSWFGQIFKSHPNVAFRMQPLFSYAFKDRLNENSTLEEINSFFEDLLVTDDAFVLQRKNGKDFQNYPKFEAKENISHIVYKEVRYHHIIENLLDKDKSIKVVGLIRNPLAEINSWLNAPKEFRRDLGWNELEEWRYAPKKNLNKKEEYNGFEHWKEVAKLFLSLSEKYPDRFYIIKYNDLLGDTINEVGKVFEFCGLDLSENTKRFIGESKQKNDGDPYGVFKIKDKDDAWKHELNPVIIKEIKSDLQNSVLEKFTFDI